MKKVICGLMVVLMVISTTIAFAIGEDYDTLVNYLNHWCEVYGYENFIDGDYVDPDGYLCYTGIINVQEYESHYNEEFTWENFKKWNKNDFDMTKLDVKQVGEAEGNRVYYMEAEANRTLAFDHNKVRVIVMIYDNDY